MEELLDVGNGFKNTDTIIHDLGADDLSKAELFLVLEEKFGINIPDDDAENFINVQDIINYIEVNTNK